MPGSQIDEIHESDEPALLHKGQCFAVTAEISTAVMSWAAPSKYQRFGVEKRVSSPATRCVCCCVLYWLQLIHPPIVQWPLTCPPAVHMIQEAP
jgi:hypothetical protein